MEWDEFVIVFLDKFFPLDLKQAKVKELVNMRYGNMSVKEYSLKSTQLAKYALAIVANYSAHMSKFMFGTFKDVGIECRNAMLFKEMDISKQMDHAQLIEEEQIKKKEIKSKRDKICSLNFCQQRSDQENYSQFHQKYSSPTPSLDSDLVPKFMQDYQDRSPCSKSQGSITSRYVNQFCKGRGKNNKGDV